MQLKAPAASGSSCLRWRGIKALPRPSGLTGSARSTGSHSASVQSGVLAQRWNDREEQRSSIVCGAAAATVTELPRLPDPSTGPYKGKTAVVVGAGPAGSTAAMFLAQQGFNVQVFEKRAEPRADTTVDTGRAYIIILIPRGQSALEELRIPLPKDPAVQYRGTVRHTFKGQTSPSAETGNVTFSRSGLAQWLIDEARKRYPGLITYHFDAGVESVDFAAQKVRFTSAGERSYDLLVGTDGAASDVRAALQAAAPSSDPLQVDVSDSGREYKVYIKVPGDIEPEDFKKVPGTTLHLFTSNDPFTSFTAHSNPDGTYTGTFSLKTGEHAKLSTAAEYEKVLTERFKGIPPQWLPQISEQLVKNAPSSAGKRIRCSRIYGPRTILLGDAAHAVTPVFGQGANSALESCRILNEVLTECKGDLDPVPAKFDAVRKADVHALYELDRKAFSFFSGKGPLDPDFLQLMSHVVLGTVLSKLLPFLYGPKPRLLTLGSRTPYSAILGDVERDAKGGLVAFLGLAMVLALKSVGMV